MYSSALARLILLARWIPAVVCDIAAAVAYWVGFEVCLYPPVRSICGVLGYVVGPGVTVIGDY
jgi:hypothetical protein